MNLDKLTSLLADDVEQGDDDGEEDGMLLSESEDEY